MTLRIPTIGIPHRSGNADDASDDSNGLHPVLEEEDGEDDHGHLLHVSDDIHHQRTSLLHRVEIGDVQEERQHAVEKQKQQGLRGGSRSEGGVETIRSQPLRPEKRVVVERQRDDFKEGE